MSDRLGRLERLQQLRAQGTLSEDEFAREKARVLAARAPRRDWIAAVILIAVVLAIGAVWALNRSSSPPGSGPTPTPSPSGTASPVASATPAASAAEQLQAAQAAAFPHGLSGAITYKPGALVEAPFGPVLVNEGSVADAAHVDAGVVAVHYLARAGDGFRMVKAFPKAVESGSFGSMSEMAVSGKFSDLPVIYAEGGGTWQGYTCGSTTLTELRPEGPVTLVSFLDSYSNDGAVESGATHENGKIANIVPGRSFDVHFTGTRTFDAHYERQGNSYRRVSGEALDGC